MANRKITDEQLNVEISVNGGNEAKKRLGELEKANRDLAQRQKELRDEKKLLERQLGKESKAYKEAATELTKVNAEVKDNKKEQGKLRKEIGLTGLTLGQLQKEQQRLTSLMTHGATKGTKEYQDLERELKQVNTAIRDQRADLRATEDAMGDTADKAEQLGSSFSMIWQGLSSGNMAQVASGLVLIRTNLKALTIQALAFLATPWGATIAALGTIGIVAKKWWDYNTAIAQTVKLTEQLTEFEGRRLSNYRAAVQATADTFDKEFNEVLRSANALSKQMGIEQEEALDLINQGFVRGADAQGQFLDKLEEYPVQFKNAGYSAQNFIDIATQEATGGVFGDKLLDAIKEADLALKEMDDTQIKVLENAFGEKFAKDVATGMEIGKLSTRDAIDLILSKADEMGINLQQKQKIIADIFKGAGEDAGGFEAILNQINKAFDEENKILSENEKATQRLIDSNTEYEQALADLFDASKSGFPAMLSNLKAIGSEISTNILVGLKNMFTSIEQLKMQAALEGQSQAVKDIYENMQQFGTTAAEEAEIQMDATLNNIQRLKGEIDDVGFFSAPGTKKALQEQLSEQEAYYDELLKIAQGKSKAFADYEASLKLEESPGLQPGSGKDEEEDRKKEKWEKRELELSQLINRIRKDREINALNGLERELALIDHRYDQEIEKAKGHADAIAELELLKEQEKNDLLASKKKEYVNRIASIEEESEKLRDEAERDREVSKLETEIERNELRLQQAREIALKELDILKEAELAKVDAVENAEQLKAAIRENFSLQAQKINREFDKQENNLRSDQVKWTELTEQQKLNAITGALGSAADAFNEGSEAWKAVKISETLITTYQSAQNAFNALAGIPVVGPALGTAAAAAAVFAGLQKVQTIKSTELNKIPKPRAKNVRGHEDGLYPDRIEVTRTDGKRFNAKYMGRAGTRLVSEPSYFTDNGGYLAAENGTEMIIDNSVFNRMDPSVIDYILNLRTGSVSGYESGMYPQSSTTTTAMPPTTDPELKMMLGMLMQRLNEPIKTYTLYGYENEEARQKLQKEMEQSTQNGKL